MQDEIPKEALDAKPFETPKDFKPPSLSEQFRYVSHHPSYKKTNEHQREALSQTFWFVLRLRFSFHERYVQPMIGWAHSSASLLAAKVLHC